MLTILGPGSSGYCDGVTRRNFLKIGALGLGGLALPQLLRAQAQSAGTASPARLGHKGVIMIFLPGGPAHPDMFDMKPDAPLEVRGPFRPIDTNVAGIQICEHLPKLAKMADKYAIIRSIVGASGGHDAVQCLTGRSPNNAPAGGWPSLGSCVARVAGPVNAAVPPFIGLSPDMGHKPWADPGAAGFLGPAFAPFRPLANGNDASSADMVLKGVTLDRLGDRRQLLSSLDTFRREVDNSGLMDSLDAFNQQAFGVLTSSQLAAALDLANEDPRVVESYGQGDPKNRDDGGPKLMEHFLIARRLVEAGARVVTLAFSRWDHHGDNFGALRQDLPLLDQGLTALITDLHQRGLEKDISVVVWGEFGRTPKINPDGGRDHWPNVSCAMLFGGGMKTGQVIGATDRIAGEATNRPVQFGEVFATLYHCLGIDVNKATVDDLTRRPRFLVDGFSPMRELVV